MSLCGGWEGLTLWAMYWSGGEVPPDLSRLNAWTCEPQMALCYGLILASHVKRNDTPPFCPMGTQSPERKKKKDIRLRFVIFYVSFPSTATMSQFYRRVFKKTKPKLQANTFKNIKLGKKPKMTSQPIQKSYLLAFFYMQLSPHPPLFVLFPFEHTVITLLSSNLLSPLPLLLLCVLWQSAGLV